MTRISLLISKDPVQAEVYVNFQQTDGSAHKRPAIIDTGAEISLFPLDLLSFIAFDAHSRQEIILEQAGVVGQKFTAIEVQTHIVLEDSQGNITKSIPIRAWFADTDRWILGMTDALARGILHIDMPALSSYIEIP